jgi:hypothetical protein
MYKKILAVLLSLLLFAGIATASAGVDQKTLEGFQTWYDALSLFTNVYAGIYYNYFEEDISRSITIGEMTSLLNFALAAYYPETNPFLTVNKDSDAFTLTCLIMINRIGDKDNFDNLELAASILRNKDDEVNTKIDKVVERIKELYTITQK